MCSEPTTHARLRITLFFHPKQIFCTFYSTVLQAFLLAGVMLFKRIGCCFALNFLSYYTVDLTHFLNVYSTGVANKKKKIGEVH